MSFFKQLKIRWYAEGGYREFLVIAIPLMLSTSSLALQEFVDRIFLAWYSPEALAAAVPAGLLHLGIIGLFISTASYTGTFVAQYYGAKIYHRVGTTVWQGIYFSIIGAVILACFIPIAPKIFELAGHELLVQEYEVIFFQILCLGSFPMIAAAAMSGFFSGLGKTWPIMLINTFSTSVTVFLDYCLIFGNFGFPEMGIKGAGIATVSSGICTVICYAALILWPSRAEKYATRNWNFDFGLFKRLIKYGLPAGIQFFIDMSGFTFFVLLIGKLGTESLVATNIAFNINTIAFLPMMGSGVAISVLVGQYIGGGRPEIAEKSTYSSYHITFIYMSTLALLFVLYPHLFVDLFVSKKHRHEMAIIVPMTVILLRFVAFYSFFDSANIIFSCAIRGAGDTFFVMIVSILSIIGLFIPTYVAINWIHSGLITCWVIATIYASILGFVFYLRFRCGAWKRMRIIERDLPDLSQSTMPE